jgi:two-component system chemotaxis response regulator CheB
MRKKITVLVAEDSPVVQLLLVHMLNADPDIEVIGTAADGQAAVEFVQKLRPDVILMDIHMPRLDGFEATRQIMETQPLPIVICSATMKNAELENTFRALEAGAVASVDKPVGIGHPNFDAMIGNVLKTIKEMSIVRPARIVRSKTDLVVKTPVAARKPREAIRMVVIGASTGGPPVLHTILAGLPVSFSAPVLIVQHIAPGFVEGMIEWLRKATKREIHLAAHGDQPLPGHVYIAPDNAQMGLTPSGRILVSNDPPENGLRPAVSFLFRTAAAAYGAGVAAVLLTGMGRDGADELKVLKEIGAQTIVQDRESSVVHGMGAEAIRLNAATHIVPPEQIASLLSTFAKESPAKMQDHGEPT